MSTRTICRYIFVTIISMIAVMCAHTAYGQQDSTVTDTTTEKKEKKLESQSSQLCLSVDIFHPILNRYTEGKYGYELGVDYYLRKEFYGVLEGGWGGSSVNYPDLTYSTTNEFARIGFNKNALSRYATSDWDVMFVGFRAGAARINRTEASYIVIDSVWGNAPGIYPGKSFGAIWAEITAGMRVELYRGLFAGWNIRAKFLMNGRSFRDLAPFYIAGYGNGDSNSTFDFNFYLSYGVRWKRQSPPIELLKDKDSGK